MDTEGQLQLLLENRDSERLDHEIKQVTVRDTTNDKKAVLNVSRDLELGAETTLTLHNFSHVDGCRQLELVVNYDRGNVLKNQKLSGTLNGQIKLEESYTEFSGSPFYQVAVTGTNSPVDAGDTLFVDYSLDNTGSSAGQATVEFYFDGSLQDTETVTVDTGTTVSGNFSMDTSGLDGSYPVRVSTGDSQDTTTVEISGGSGTSPSPSPSPSPARYLLGVNVSTPSQVEVYSNGTLQDSRSVNSYTSFNLSAGNYSVNASAPDYQDASATVELDSNTNVSLELQRYPPEVLAFEVVDNSVCHGYWCAFGRGNGPAEYQVRWNVTDRYGELQSASILFNGVEEFTGKSGTDSYRESNSYGDEYMIRLEANYTGTTLCREVEDVADSNDPPESEYSVC